MKFDSRQVSLILYRIQIIYININSGYQTKSWSVIFRVQRQSRITQMRPKSWYYNSHAHQQRSSSQQEKMANLGVCQRPCSRKRNIFIFFSDSVRDDNGPNRPSFNVYTDPNISEQILLQIFFISQMEAKPMSEDYNETVTCWCLPCIKESIPQVTKAILSMEAQGRFATQAPFIVAEFGCATGYSSIPTLSEVVHSVRQSTTDLPILIYLNDLPDNHHSIAIKTVNYIGGMVSRAIQQHEGSLQYARLV